MAPATMLVPVRLGLHHWSQTATWRGPDFVRFGSLHSPPLPITIEPLRLRNASLRSVPPSEAGEDRLDAPLS